jgi:uncharacterized protein YndB with AHSA1/START domain
MSKSIKQQFFFAHPPQAVWEYLTNADLMQLWLMKNDFQPILGFDFQFTTKPIPSMELDGIFNCKVLEITPFEKLSYTWKGGPGNGEVTLDTVVTWQLEATPKGTELYLEQSGFGKTEHVTIFNAMSGGWAANVQKIIDRLNATQHADTIA